MSGVDPMLFQELGQVADNLRAFYENLRLSKFTETEALALTGTFLGILLPRAREAAGDRP